MAIIKIPASKIFNYNYDVLRDNYINKVYLIEEDTYNFIPINFDITYNTLNQGTLTTSSNLVFEIKDVFSQSTITSGSYTYYVNYGYLQLPNKEYYNYDTFIDSIKNIFLNDLEVSFSSSDDYRNQSIHLPEEKTGGHIVFDKNISNDGKLYLKIAYLRETTTFTYLPFVMYLKPTFVENTYVYQLNDGSADKYSLESNTFYDKLNVEERTGDTLFQYIAKNIVDNYNYGLMGLEIETRVSDFYDSEGNLINDGKPYLIKVGDMVIPEFPKRLKMFEKTFIVTSSQYEYTGKEVVNLKLLEYKVIDTTSWHSFYSSSNFSLDMVGENYYRKIISNKPATLETKKIKLTGTLNLGGTNIELNNIVDVKIENNFTTRIITSGSNYLDVFITYSGSNKYYLFSSNYSATIINMVLEEGY